MKRMKKIEVVIDTIHLEHLISLLENKGFTGYTIIKDVYGKGERGLMIGDEVTGVFQNSYLFTICEEQQLNDVIEDLRKMLKKYGGVCIVSDVDWLIH